MIKKRGLGRGLNALLEGTKQYSPQDEFATVSQQKGELQHLPVEYLQRGQYQPRKDMDAESLEELAESIRAQGIIQPIIVRAVSEQSYEIIAGERRWRAAQLAGLAEVPALIREISDEAAMAVALIENIQRENLNPLEEASALKRLMDEFDMTHQEVATAVGKSRTAVTNILRLLGLNSAVKILLAHGDLDMGHAKALLALEGMMQDDAAREIVAKELSVREAEKLVKQMLSGKARHKQKVLLDPNVTSLQNELSDKLGSKVEILHHKKGRGKLVIHYHSVEGLEGILARIQ